MGGQRWSTLHITSCCVADRRYFIVCFPAFDLIELCCDALWHFPGWLSPLETEDCKDSPLCFLSRLALSHFFFWVKVLFHGPTSTQHACHAHFISHLNSPVLTAVLHLQSAQYMSSYSALSLCHSVPVSHTRAFSGFSAS